MMRRDALTVTCVVALVAVGLLTAGADQKVELYSGSLDKVDLAAWGAGTVEQTDEEMYLDAETLRVDTKGFFEGGRIDLKDSVDIKPYVGDPDGAYVLMVVKAHKPEPPQVGVGVIGPGWEMMPGAEIIPGEAFPMEEGPETGDARQLIRRWQQMGMRPRDMLNRWEEMGRDRQEFMEAWREMQEEPPEAMGPPEEPMGEGMPAEGMWAEEGMMEGLGPEAGPTVPSKPAAPPPEVKRLRVLLVTDQGELDSGPVVLADCSEIVEGWLRVVIPMSAFQGTKEIKSGSLEQLALFGDVEEHFFIGQLEIGQEDNPLLADAGEDKAVRADREVTFTAKEQAAGVRANYTWDFDNIDGIQEDGYGTEAKWTFITPGYYTVTLTVTDPANRKVTRTDQAQVKVE